MSAGHAFSPEELERALVGATVGVWAWDIATNRVRWSRETERIFGMDPGVFHGTLDAYLALMHPDDLESARGAIERAIAQKERVFRLNHRAIRPDGTTFWAESRGTVSFDAAGEVTGMLGTVVDSSEEKRKEEQIRVNEDLSLLLAELSPDYVYRSDFTRPALVPEVVAGSFERTTGYAPSEIAAAGGWFKIVHPDDLRNFEALIPALASGRPAVNEYRIRDKDGEIRWLRDRVRPVLDPKTGALVGIYGGVQEITEQKRLEEQLLHAQKMDALAHLAGSVAHDFNNLLLVMGLALEMIAERGRAGKPADARDVDDVRSAARRAAELTQSLLAFSRQQPAQRQVVDLGAVVESSMPILTRAAGGTVRVSVRSPPGGVRAWADPARLQLVLLNLVVNARDAQPEGGEVRLEIGSVQLEADSEWRPPELAVGLYATLRVSDDGGGMDAATLRRIFEPFFTTKAPGLGTGLGLATAHGFLRQMGGAITVRSAPGAGATFILYLPPAEDAAVPRQESAALTSVGGTEAVLVVEDEAAVRRLIARTLRDRGYDVVTAESGEEALALPATELARFRLVISDYRLAGTDGVTVLEAMKERAPGAKRLLMSGFVAADPQSLVRVTDAFLGKPFTPDGLARKVRETLDR